MTMPPRQGPVACWTRPAPPPGASAECASARRSCTAHTTRRCTRTIARPGNGHPALATWRDLGSIQLLLALHGERGVELYCETLLGPLVAHDRDHGSALVESLQAFIEANGRWADAAAELHVHRHTLRYRMRQIEQLTGRSLTDARDRLELWMALRAHALQETHRDGRATPV